MLLRFGVPGFLNRVHRTRAGIVFPALDLLVPKHRNVLAVLGRPDGRVLIPASNIITDAGDVHYAEKGAGEVTEIELPSTPLGALGDDYGQARLQLEAGDLVVWLSDGLIEATDERQEDFGYRRITETLTGLDADPAAVRDHLLDAIARHTGGGTPEDDCTLLVMAYLGVPKPKSSSPSSVE